MLLFHFKNIILFVFFCEHAEKLKINTILNIINHSKLNKLKTSKN